jgi:hypothetical protein
MAEQFSFTIFFGALGGALSHAMPNPSTHPQGARNAQTCLYRVPSLLSRPFYTQLELPGL